MKTTVEIADPLLKKAKKLAAEQGTTLRDLMERGLRQVLAEKTGKKKKPFKLRFVTVKGEGLQPEFKDAGWEKIRDAIYENDGK